LKLLDSYDLLSREDLKTYEQCLENPNSFSTTSTTDAARRQTKIARFKGEKALKSKIEVQCHAHMDQGEPSHADRSWSWAFFVRDILTEFYCISQEEHGA